MNELKKDRIEFYQKELCYWNLQRDLRIEALLNNDLDLEFIESKISNYQEWLKKELEEKE